MDMAANDPGQINTAIYRTLMSVRIVKTKPRDLAGLEVIRWLEPAWFSENEMQGNPFSPSEPVITVIKPVIPVIPIPVVIVPAITVTIESAVVVKPVIVPVVIPVVMIRI
jgi:hypothetical protein